MQLWRHYWLLEWYLIRYCEICCNGDGAIQQQDLFFSLKAQAFTSVAIFNGICHILHYYPIECICCSTLVLRVGLVHITIYVQYVQTLIEKSGSLNASFSSYLSRNHESTPSWPRQQCDSWQMVWLTAAFSTIYCFGGVPQCRHIESQLYFCSHICVRLHVAEKEKRKLGLNN